MGTKNKPGSYDCYANADPDEPLFVLLGRDPLAGALVRHWAEVRRETGEDPAKVKEALDCAAAMDAWARRRGKVPDDCVKGWARTLAEKAARGWDGLDAAKAQVLRRFAEVFFD